MKLRDQKDTGPVATPTAGRKNTFESSVKTFKPFMHHPLCFYSSSLSSLYRYCLLHLFVYQWLVIRPFLKISSKTLTNATIKKPPTKTNVRALQAYALAKTCMAEDVPIFIKRVSTRLIQVQKCCVLSQKVLK